VLHIANFTNENATMGLLRISSSIPNHFGGIKKYYLYHVMHDYQGLAPFRNFFVTRMADHNILHGTQRGLWPFLPNFQPSRANG